MNVTSVRGISQVKCEDLSPKASRYKGALQTGGQKPLMFQDGSGTT
jgi:hypothetical protein